MNEFQEEVLRITSMVPKGKVTTYKAIAEIMGNKAYRAVGTALNKNPYAPDIPCHRVVSSSGNIGGYAFGIEKKIQILKEEGISVDTNGRVENFKEILWK